MKVAICDVNKNFVLKMKSIVYNYANINRLDIVADCYLSGEVMIKNPVYYNIIFLGYELIGINGLETAKILRENSVESPIIFISNNTEFILEAFKVSPCRFLYKNVSEGELFSVLDDFLKTSDKNCFLWVKYKTDTVCIKKNDIYYVEANNKYSVIHLKNESLNCNRTLSAVSIILPKNRFSKINRSFIVNMDYITKYNRDLIFLSNGEKLHPGRTYYKGFTEDYRKHCLPTEI